MHDRKDRPSHLFHAAEDRLKGRQHFECAKGSSFKVNSHVASWPTAGSAEVSMSDIKLASWEEILQKTLDETDPKKLAQFVPEAELAMFKRQQELNNRPLDDEELGAMSIAAEALRVVKRRITKPRVLGLSKGDPARFANFVRRSKTA
jgi:hypothetical protein